jgi:hypothetical protein
MTKYYILSRRIRYVILADSPMDAIAKMITNLSPSYEDFGKAIVVSQKGFELEKHTCGVTGENSATDEKDAAFDRDKTLSHLGFSQEN